MVNVWIKRGPHTKSETFRGDLHGGSYKLRDQKQPRGLVQT